MWGWASVWELAWAWGWVAGLWEPAWEWVSEKEAWEWAWLLVWAWGWALEACWEPQPARQLQLLLPLQPLLRPLRRQLWPHLQRAPYPISHKCLQCFAEWVCVLYKLRVANLACNFTTSVPSNNP